MNKEIFLSLRAEVRGNPRFVSRELHLAYGLVRGVPYNVMEKTCHNHPSTYGIAHILYNHGLRIEGMGTSAWVQTTAIEKMLRPLITRIAPKKRVKKPRADHAAE